MVNLLVGSSKKETKILYQELANEKNIIIRNTVTGADTLSAYWKTSPDILILDNSIPDIPIEDLLNKLSSNPVEKKKCNTILTVPSNSKTRFSKVAKVNEIIYKPMKNHELRDVVKSMALDFNTPDLEFGEIDFLLQELNFNSLSPGFLFMRSAIEFCYYNPYKLEFLNNILNHVAHEQHIPATRVRDALNSSLRHFNNSNIISEKINLYDIFGNHLRNITLKDFLERITLYLLREKKKKGRLF